MSRVHDALRRGRPSAQNHARTKGPSAHADRVLATLGYRRAHSSTPRRLATLLLVMLALGAYLAWARVRADEPAADVRHRIERPANRIK